MEKVIENSVISVAWEERKERSTDLNNIEEVLSKCENEKMKETWPHVG